MKKIQHCENHNKLLHKLNTIKDYCDIIEQDWNERRDSLMTPHEIIKLVKDIRNIIVEVNVI